MSNWHFGWLNPLDEYESPEARTKRLEEQQRRRRASARLQLIIDVAVSFVIGVMITAPLWWWVFK